MAETLCAKTFVSYCIIRIDAIYAHDSWVYIIFTTIKGIKHTIFYVCFVLAKAVRQKRVVCSIVISNAFTVKTELGIDTKSTAVSSIKVAMQVIGVVMAVPISNKSSQLAL